MHRNKKLTCLQVSVKNWNNRCHVRKVSGGLDVKQRELYVQSEKYKVVLLCLWNLILRSYNENQEIKLGKQMKDLNLIIAKWT